MHDAIPIRCNLLQPPNQPLTHMPINITDPSLTPSTNLNNLSFSKTLKPREGREFQMYSSVNNARLVAGGIVLDDHHEKVLMISSSKHKHKWIVPKGGVEFDEKDNFALSALREVWEEAGVVGTISRKLDPIPDHRIAEGKSAEDFPLCEFHFYQMKLEKLETNWPEADIRLRRWCNYKEAKHELLKSKRPELLQALNMSDIVKPNIDILVYDKNNHMTDPQLDDDKDYNHL